MMMGRPGMFNNMIWYWDPFYYQRQQERRARGEEMNFLEGVRLVYFSYLQIWVFLLYICDVFFRIYARIGNPESKCKRLQFEPFLPGKPHTPMV